MKNSLFGLIATMLFSLSGFAQGKNTQEPKVISESAIITITEGDAKTDYKFNSVKEFAEYSDKILDSYASRTEANSGSGDAPCTMTITMSVTVVIEASAVVIGGSASTTVTGSITTSCADAVAAGKRLRDQLLAMAGG
jgi:hypothetical protein